MQVTLLKSKLHRASITAVSPDYSGSLSIDRTLMREAGLLHHEKVLVGNITNGERFETYCIYGAAGSGVIELNGATAHLGKIGDRLTIMSYGYYSSVEAVGAKPAVLLLDESNTIVRESGTVHC